MSIFSKIWKGIRGVAAPVIGGLIGGPLGAVAGRALAGGTKAVATSQQLAPLASRAVLPGAGAMVSAGGLGALVGAQASSGSRTVTAMLDAQGNVVGIQPRRRRRSRGITATELKNHKRVQNFLDKNYKCTTARRVVRRK